MCPEPILLSNYLDDELEHATRSEVERHLGECSRCAERYLVLKRQQDLLRSDKLEIDNTLRSMQARVRRKLSTHPRMQERKPFWQQSFNLPIPALAAALLVAVFLGAGGSVLLSSLSRPAPVSSRATRPFEFALSVGNGPDYLQALDNRHTESEITIQLPMGAVFVRSGAPVILTRRER